MRENGFPAAAGSRIRCDGKFGGISRFGEFDKGGKLEQLLLVCRRKGTEERGRALHDGERKKAEEVVVEGMQKVMEVKLVVVEGKRSGAQEGSWDKRM